MSGAKHRSQAKASHSGRLFLPSQYAIAHCRAFFASLGKLLRSPFSSIMTILVIGVALALPSSLFVLLNNVKIVGQGWDKGSQISLYLNQDSDQTDIDKIIGNLKLRSDVAFVEYISPEQGLTDFKNHSGYGEVLEHLPSNPIPPVIEVYPDTRLQSPELVENLLRDLEQLPTVENAQLDMQWLKRLYAFIQLGQRGVMALVLLFSLGVLLIIGNTIRLLTHSQRKEIAVIKLIGGTNAFIRRPFLYTGILYGLFGGLTAWLFVEMELFWLQTPVSKLSGAYGSQFQLLGLGSAKLFLLLLVSTLLGFLGSWVAVSRQMSAYDPK